jgi:hypothetical protein
MRIMRRNKIPKLVLRIQKPGMKMPALLVKMKMRRRTNTTFSGTTTARTSS